MTSLELAQLTRLCEIASEAQEIVRQYQAWLKESRETIADLTRAFDILMQTNRLLILDRDRWEIIADSHRAALVTASVSALRPHAVFN